MAAVCSGTSFVGKKKVRDFTHINTSSCEISTRWEISCPGRFKSRYAHNITMEVIDEILLLWTGKSFSQHWQLSLHNQESTYLLAITYNREEIHILVAMVYINLTVSLSKYMAQRSLATETIYTVDDLVKYVPLLHYPLF